MYEAMIKSRQNRKGVGQQAAQAAKAPAGYSLAPGSKKGRYRKKVGNKWQYYDPNKVSGKTHGAKMKALVASTKGAPAALGGMLQAAALGDFARASELGQAYRKHHHKIDELIELLHVVELAAHTPIHVASHAVSHAAGGMGHMISQYATAFAMGGADQLALRKAKSEEDDEDKEEEARDKKIAQENGEDEDEDDGDGDEDAAEDRKEAAAEAFKAMNFGAVLRKSAAHKYVSRSPDGKGGYRYRYATDVRRNLGAIAEARALKRDMDAEEGHHGRALLAAQQRRGKPGFLERFTGGRSATHEMERHTREGAAARSESEILAEADAFHSTGQKYDDVQSVGDAMLEAFAAGR